MRTVLATEAAALQALDTGTLEVDVSWEHQFDLATQQVTIEFFAAADDSCERWVVVGQVELDLADLEDPAELWTQLDFRCGDAYTLAEGLLALLANEDTRYELESNLVRRALLVQRVWVEPGLRGRGLGRRLLLAAIKVFEHVSADTLAVLTYPMPDDATNSEDEAFQARAVRELLDRLALEWRQTGFPGVHWELSHQLLKKGGPCPLADG